MRPSETPPPSAPAAPEAADPARPDRIPEGIEAAETPPAVLPELRPRGGPLGFALRNPFVFAGMALVALLALVAALAPWLGTVDPARISPLDRTLPPSAEHWFGTDMAGRDVYSRVLFGTRVSLIVGFGTALVASVVGLAVGLAAGASRRLDGPIMRLMDAVMSIPAILLGISLLAVAGGSILSVIAAISAAEFPRMARLVRGQVLSLRDLPYVEAARTTGTRPLAMMRRHILPGIVAPMTVQATYVCAVAILLEASLSFVGAGLPPTIPSWGNIMAEGKAIWQVKPSIIFIPAGFLAVTVLAVNLVGDGLRDMLDPRAAART